MENKKKETSEPHQEKEFGGPIGVGALMIWSHYILLYFWYCLESNNGKFVFPTSVDNLSEHLHRFGGIFMEKGIPSPFTWACYFSFFVVQLGRFCCCCGVAIDSPMQTVVALLVHKTAHNIINMRRILQQTVLIVLANDSKMLFCLLFKWPFAVGNPHTLWNCICFICCSPSSYVVV